MMKYDVIIIGSGMGGSTMAYQLAKTGKSILVIERGDYIPVEKENWMSKKVFKEGIYTTDETWLDKDGKAFTPGMHYCVGGNTKMYGAALFRLREEDFGEIKHYGGISPAWPIQYDDLKDYYLAAEALYCVHGERGADPTDPEESRPFPHAAIPHEPRIQEVVDRLKSIGLNPSPLPLGVNLEPHPSANAPYTLDRFDGYPDAAERKGDAHIAALSKAMLSSNVSLMTNAKVLKLNTDASGKKVTEVMVVHRGEEKALQAELVVLSAGAVNSAVILLNSANQQHPNGLANSSDQVGRNFMFHQNTALLAIGKARNDSKFGKTFVLNDYYHAGHGFDHPLGSIQMLGKSDEEQIEADSPVPAPGFTFEMIAKHSVDFWLTSEDLPLAENRVTVENGKIKISYTPNNQEAHQLLKEAFTKKLKETGDFDAFFLKGLFFSKGMDLSAPAHQNGTTKMGSDPKTSVVDTWCKAHDLDNLYIVDGGFFVSCGAVNPSLTIAAMALRVGERLSKVLTS